MIALVAVPLALAVVAAAHGAYVHRDHRFRFQRHSTRLRSIR